MFKSFFSDNLIQLTVSESLKRSNNNLDVVRLIAAIAVIYGHTFAVAPTPGTGIFFIDLRVIIRALRR